jgi:hypothetical protein
MQGQETVAGQQEQTKVWREVENARCGRRLQRLKALQRKRDVLLIWKPGRGVDCLYLGFIHPNKAGLSSDSFLMEQPKSKEGQARATALSLLDLATAKRARSRLRVSRLCAATLATATCMLSNAGAII